jgi:hypothetical protein
VKNLEEELVSTSRMIGTVYSVLKWPKDAGGEASTEEVAKAKDAITKGKESVGEAS